MSAFLHSYISIIDVHISIGTHIFFSQSFKTDFNTQWKMGVLPRRPWQLCVIVTGVFVVPSPLFASFFCAIIYHSSCQITARLSIKTPVRSLIIGLGARSGNSISVRVGYDAPVEIEAAVPVIIRLIGPIHLHLPGFGLKGLFRKRFKRCIF